MESERWLSLRRAGRRGARKVGVASLGLAVLACVVSSLPAGFVAARLQVRPKVSLESAGPGTWTRVSVGGSFSFEARVSAFEHVGGRPGTAHSTIEGDEEPEDSTGP